MNFARRLLNRFFGVEYVMLFHVDEKTQIKRAYELGGKVWANPYLPSTRVELMPQGRIAGRSYVNGWIPLTERTRQLFNMESKNDPA